MFYPIVIVVKEASAAAAQSLAEGLAVWLGERFGEDEFGLSLYDGGVDVPAVSVDNRYRKAAFV